MKIAGMNPSIFYCKKRASVIRDTAAASDIRVPVRRFQLLSKKNAGLGPAFFIYLCFSDWRCDFVGWARGGPLASPESSSTPSTSPPPAGFEDFLAGDAALRGRVRGEAGVWDRFAAVDAFAVGPVSELRDRGLDLRELVQVARHGGDVHERHHVGDRPVIGVFHPVAHADETRIVL